MTSALDWKKVLIPADATLRQTLQTLEAGLQISLVVDENERLLGTVTDGDIRRSLLQDASLDSPVSGVMNTSFVAAKVSDRKEEILEIMRKEELRQMPVLDADGRIVNVWTLLGLLEKARHDNWVVLMAGGLGTRLRPLTEECPKPLLRVGGKPVLQTIIESFVDQGFSKFYLSVNYKAEMIKSYFGDGSSFNAEIRYVHEDQRLGTAGALGLLPERPVTTFFVMNGDLLTQVDFEKLLSFHEEHSAVATMGVREYDVQIPYGVVDIDDNSRITCLREKPVHTVFVNAGIYAVEPQALDLISANEYLDMPTLFERLMDKGEGTVAFPIHEYWLDIGQRQDFDRANDEFHGRFAKDPGKC